MKKIKLLGLAFIALFVCVNFSACSSDDESGDKVVSLTKPGELKQLLGDDFLNITSLKVIGPINGDDIYCFRRMFDRKGKASYLTSLDLSEASIVEGGRRYIDTDSDSEFNSNFGYTSNNIIGRSMFYNSNLTSIILPAGVTTIEDWAFGHSFDLTSIDIPDGVTSIGDYAFYLCSSLTSIDIPDGVTSIGDHAFYLCSSLTSIDIPAGVTTVGACAFSLCPSLSVYCYAEIPPDITSNYIQKAEIYLYVPMGSGAAYRNSEWNSYVTTIIEMNK